VAAADAEAAVVVAVAEAAGDAGAAAVAEAVAAAVVVCPGAPVAFASQQRARILLIGSNLLGRVRHGGPATSSLP
jgi:hypothetical protein